MLDTVMIEYFKGDAAVGYYTNSVKIVRMIYTVSIALVATFYPRISSLFSEKKQEEANQLLSKGTSILLLISIPAVIGLLIMADYIVPVLLGEAFLPSVNILRILSVLVLVFSIAYFLGHLVLMASGNENKILRATICGAIVNATMNFCLIPMFSANGAAIASVTAEVIVTSIMLVYSHGFIKLSIGSKFVRSLIISNVLMILAIFVVRGIFTNYYIGLFITILCAIVVYFIGLMITRNEVVMLLVKRFKR